MKRYTLLFHDGIGPYSPCPDAPTADNQAGSMLEASDVFKAWMRDSGNDYTRADGYDAPWADVYLTEMWDGISYGEPLWRIQRGPRGGAIRTSF